MNGFTKYVSTHFEEDKEKTYTNHLLNFKQLLKNFDDSKIFSCEEIETEILPYLKEYDGVMGMVYFKNDRPRSIFEICSIFASMQTRVDMAFYKELGPKGKVICNCCANAFNENEPETSIMLREFDKDLGETFLCHNCRRIQGKKLRPRDFIEAYKNPDLKSFINEEQSLGFDYSKELQRIN